MNILKIYIIYRLPIAALLIVLGVLSHLYFDVVTAWICYVLALFSIILYFMVGTMRLVQKEVEEGNVEQAQKYLNMIKFPKLLFKPVRVGYYMLQSNLALTSADYAKAEKNARMSLKTKSSIAGDTTGVSLMQLGFIQIKNGNIKEARQTLMEAVKAGIPDKEALAGVHLQLCSIELQRHQNRVAKEHFRKAKALKPKTEELASQIKIMDKQLARLPG